MYARSQSHLAVFPPKTPRKIRSFLITVRGRRFFSPPGAADTFNSLLAPSAMKCPYCAAAAALIAFLCPVFLAPALAQEASPRPRDPGADYFADAIGDGEIADAAEQTVSTDVAVAADATATDSSCPPAKMAALKKQVATAYKPLFYDNNFNYLCDECYDDFHLGEGLKRNCLGDSGLGNL